MVIGFEKWLVEDNLNKLLEPKDIKIFREHNMGYSDLKLFGVSEEISQLLLYDWAISKRNGVG